MKSFSVTLNVKAIGKGRPRATKGGRMYTPKETANAEAEIRWLLQKEKPPCLTGPVWIVVKVFFMKPKSVSKKRLLPLVKPDLSNILKLIEDAANGILFTDDCLICRAEITKEYGPANKIELVVGEIE